MIKFVLFGTAPEYNPEFGRLPTDFYNWPITEQADYLINRTMVAQMTFEEWLATYDPTNELYLEDVQMLADAWNAAMEQREAEVDRLKQECEQLRAALYKAYDYIHEGDD